jgi:hypothetical protein
MWRKLNAPQAARADNKPRGAKAAARNTNFHTLKTIVILFAKFRGTRNHDEQSERWPLLQIANSSRRDCGSFSAPQPTAILFYRACPQLA